jgi:hypothetical protein
MNVYKYLHPDRSDVLKNGLIRFTQPGALNDPFEVTPNLREFRQYFERLHKQLFQQMGATATNDDLQSTQQAITDTFGQWNEANASNLAFLSLSKNRNNLLMWSHYCDSHRGFVVGFDSADPFFSNAKDRIKSDLREVVYSSSRPVLPTLDQDPEKFFRENTNILTKSHHWAYEEELRMSASPMAADEVKSGPNGHQLYLFKFPPESVREVILGHRILAKVEEEIVKVARENTIRRTYLRP